MCCLLQQEEEGLGVVAAEGLGGTLTLTPAPAQT